MFKPIRLSEELAPRALKLGKDEVVRDGGDRIDETVVDLSKNKKSRKLKHVLNIRVTRKPNFLTSNAKKALNYLQLAFIKAPIL